VKNPAGIKLNNDEDVGGPEEEIMNDSEITGPDLSSVVFEKSCPRLVSFSSFLGHISLDSTFTDFDIEFEQLPSDSFGPPQLIIFCHPLDEGDDLGRDVRLVLVVSRFASPIDPKKLALPPEKGVGLHNVKSLLPIIGKSGQDDQAKAIIIGQSWLIRSPIENYQLLPEHGIFN
jgi:hypothetical protein